jgi:hypothetical protein
MPKKPLVTREYKFVRSTKAFHLYVWKDVEENSKLWYTTKLYVSVEEMSKPEAFLTMVISA